MSANLDANSLPNAAPFVDQLPESEDKRTLVRSAIDANDPGCVKTFWML